MKIKKFFSEINYKNNENSKNNLTDKDTNTNEKTVKLRESYEKLKIINSKKFVNDNIFLDSIYREQEKATKKHILQSKLKIIVKYFNILSIFTLSIALIWFASGFKTISIKYKLSEKLENYIDERNKRQGK